MPGAPVCTVQVDKVPNNHCADEPPPQCTISSPDVAPPDRAPHILPSPRRALTLRCVAQAPELTRGASALRDLASVHGSTDNISALVVDLTGV